MNVEWVATAAGSSEREQVTSDEKHVTMPGLFDPLTIRDTCQQGVRLADVSVLKPRWIR